MKSNKLLKAGLFISAILIVILTLTSIDNVESASITNYTVTSGLKTTPYGTVVKKSFSIDAFTPKEGQYGYLLYNGEKMSAFLKDIIGDFILGDIVEVDGLKWKKQLVSLGDGYNIESWEPYPNPPMPVLEKGEDISKHLKAYSKWINDHPHFGYPPLPLFD